jgi:uncharacterized protein involved in exopolysaccharide biosynthesis
MVMGMFRSAIKSVRSRPLLGPALVGITGGFFVALALLIMPNRYTSEAKLLPAEGRSSTSGMGGIAAAAAMFGVTMPGNENADANSVEILESRWLRERLLARAYHFNSRSWAFATPKPEVETLQAYLRLKNTDQALGKLDKLMTATRDLKTHVVTLTVETESPELSQALVNDSLGLLEEFVHMKGKTRGGMKAEFAEARLNEAREELARSEDSFRGFLEGNRNYAMSPDPVVRLQGLRLEADFKLHQQLVLTLAMNREQALMEEKNDLPILNILDTGNLPQLKSGPARTLIVLASIVLIGGIWATVVNWRWVRKQLWEEGPEAPH